MPKVYDETKFIKHTFEEVAKNKAEFLSNNGDIEKSLKFVLAMNDFDDLRIWEISKMLTIEELQESGYFEVPLKSFTPTTKQAELLKGGW